MTHDETTDPSQAPQSPQPGWGHGTARYLERFDELENAMERIDAIYATAASRVSRQLGDFLGGDREAGREACYPYVGIDITADSIPIGSDASFGIVRRPGSYGTTLTRPDLFARYYREQLGALMKNHKVPLLVGVSDRRIPLHFLGDAMATTPEQGTVIDIDAKDAAAMRALFQVPDLSRIDDTIPNGTYEPAAGHPWPLALFTAERVDFSLDRLHHYCGTAPEHFQGFVLTTNYHRYVGGFIDWAKQSVAAGGEIKRVVEPGNVTTRRTADGSTETVGEPPAHLPQMPAYHAVREDGLGVTLVNIGVGPSNAKTLTDHLAVLRPHCWLMLGHCGGLRHSQRLGDYVLAHAYVREDHVLDDDLAVGIPLPVIAEVQIAIQNAVESCTGMHGQALKSRMRTGTVATTDNRNWELRYRELSTRFSQSRAIAIDMESATLAANGFRLRVPYGTLLCVSDKPLHGELKLRNMANTFYRESVSQHLNIGLETVRLLRETGIEQLHSRKLRSFHEPPFL